MKKFFFKKKKISPLFKEYCIEKEIKAIDSEFELLKGETDNEFDFLFRSLSDKNSEFCKFGDGNKQSLKLKNLRQYLIDFYNKYYSSNLMKLVM